MPRHSVAVAALALLLRPSSSRLLWRCKNERASRSFTWSISSRCESLNGIVLHFLITPTYLGTPPLSLEHSWDPLVPVLPRLSRPTLTGLTRPSSLSRSILEKDMTSRTSRSAYIVSVMVTERLTSQPLQLDRNGEQLIQAVAAQKNDTIVVINSGSPVDVSVAPVHR